MESLLEASVREIFNDADAHLIDGIIEDM